MTDESITNCVDKMSENGEKNKLMDLNVLFGLTNNPKLKDIVFTMI